MLKVKYISLANPVEVDADQYVKRDGKIELYLDGHMLESIYEDLVEYVVLYGEIEETEEYV